MLEQAEDTDFLSHVLFVVVCRVKITSRSCLFLRIESALLEQAEDIHLTESVFLHQLIQSSFLRFHRVDTLIIGLRYEVERNKNEWEKMGKQ